MENNNIPIRKSILLIFLNTDEDRDIMCSRMEKALLKLVRAEIVYSKSTDIVNEVAEEMPDDESAPNATANIDEIIRSCDQIAEVKNTTSN